MKVVKIKIVAELEIVAEMPKDSTDKEAVETIRGAIGLVGLDGMNTTKPTVTKIEVIK